MPLDELIKEMSKEVFDDLKEDKNAGFNIDDPDCADEAVRRIEYWLMKLVIRGGSLG